MNHILDVTFTMEDAFVSCLEASSHGVWLKSFIIGFRIVNSRSKDIDIKYLIIRENIIKKKSCH